jgi:hypothetical protein
MARLWTHASHEFSIIQEGQAPVLAPWIREISYSDAAESSVVKGAGGVILGTTDPEYTPGESSITVLPQPFNLFTKQVTLNGQYRLSSFDFVISAKKRTAQDARLGAEPSVDTIKCQFSGRELSSAQGTADPNQAVMALVVTEVLVDGVKL